MHSLLFTITYMHIVSCEVGSSKIKEAGYLAGGWHLMRTENRMCMYLSTYQLFNTLKTEPSSLIYSRLFALCFTP